MEVETEYYIRLLLLLVKGGMQVCKGIILRELAGLGLDTVLKPLQSALKGKLLKSQYIVLFPKGGKPDVDDLDLSLLTVVLLDVFVLSTTDAQYVQVIKQTRNKLVHNTAASIDQTDYTKTKTDLEDALAKLVKGLDTTMQKECSELIQKYTTEPLDETTIIKYVKELRNDDELLQDFEELLEKQSTGIKQEIKASESRMQESLSDVKENLMDAIQKLQIEQSSDELFHNRITGALPDCEMCSIGNTATWYCDFCSTFLCSECKITMHSNCTTHNCRRIMKDEPIKLEMNGLNLCNSHSKNILYLCEVHDSLCCDRCLNERHVQCKNVVSISKVETGSTFNPTLEILRLQNEAEQVKVWTDSTKKFLKKEIESIPKQLEKKRNALLDLFDQEAQIVKDKANALQNKTAKDITMTQMHCDNVIEKLKLGKRPLINLAKCGSNSQKVIAKYRIKEFQENVKPLTSINVVTCNLVEERMSSPSLRQSEALSIQVKSPDTTPLKVFQAASVELIQSEDEVKMPLYTGLDFLPDGRLVALDNHNMKCLIFSEKLEKVGSYQLSYLPQNVVVVSEDIVAITGGAQYMIYFLRVSKSNEITLIRTCKVTTPYACICMKDDWDFVVGTFDDTRPVRIVSLSGEEKDFSINFPNRQYPIDDSSCTYIRNSGKVVLIDINDHTVYIYDVATNTEVVVKDDQIKEPRGVAVGPFDCLFVCSMKTDSIVQLSQTGRILTSHKLNMKYPYSICVSQDKTKVAVSNCSFKRRDLQMFNIVF